MRKITLKSARAIAGLTQQELADMLYISRCTLRNYETGKTKIPYSVFKDWCRVCEVSEELVVV